MISYKYKLYRNRRTRHLDAMLREASFVWNHALALQRRYYRLYGRYISCKRMKAHFAHRVHRELLHSQTVQEVLERRILVKGLLQAVQILVEPSLRREGEDTHRQAQPPWGIFHRHGSRQAPCQPRKDTLWCIRGH